jgi:hypothetical protein
VNGLANQEDSPAGALKMTADGNQLEILESSRGVSLSSNGEPLSDAASVHSLPIVHVTTHPQSPLPTRPSTARTLHSPASMSRAQPPSPRGPISPSESFLTPQDGRNRHRSVIDVRTVQIYTLRLFLTTTSMSDPFIQPSFWLFYELHA